ncbi:NUDIX domain-containing protein [Pseudalkalibacillus berkeleyi]|uniref:NUDIX domain-containing protein n=1 Tax=Pseudalkalibacillus berkeleyi TaxID=1069813 RepID=A0ABS9GUT9_9BACL|nr:NUDIX domain-containing protein [Pseudalkalibacillus berkeleyi]MCF6136607.1 NUDIX domain-containing protein [Pseudalkalibacillus berkeleyi]
MSYHMRVRAGAIIIEDNKILLTEYDNPIRGKVYDFPAGGTEPNETISEAVMREALEEACIEVKVGSLAFVYEYAPHLNQNKFGDTHTLTLLFDCERRKDTIPRLPDTFDANQSGVKWVPLSELENIEMYANIQDQLKDYIWTNRNIVLIEER